MEFGYCIRIDERAGYIEKIPGLALYTEITHLVVVKHRGRSRENPHFHLVVRAFIKLPALRAKLRKIFDNGKGNGHMSIKAWDYKEEALSYLFHEEEVDTPLLLKGWSDQEVSGWKARNTQVQKDSQGASYKAVDLAIMQLERDLNGSAASWEVIEDEYIFNVIMGCIRDTKLHWPSKFQMRHYIDQVKKEIAQRDDDTWNLAVIKFRREFFS
jgi:hypothetical protein